MTDLAVHPVADLFPMLADDELQELAADIAVRGQLQPIVLDTEGRVLDGRNRLAACKVAGVAPVFETYDGEDPDGYALAVNGLRREMTKGQKAIVAALFSKFENRGEQGKAARALGVHDSQVSDAVVIVEYARDLAQSVIAGARPFSKALEVAHERKAEAEALEAKMTRLQGNAADLHALIGERRMDVDDAIAALDARELKAREEAEAERAAEHARSVEERRDIEAAQRTAETIVTEFRTLAVTVLAGVRLGEPDLITKAMVSDLRATIDLLEGEL